MYKQHTLTKMTEAFRQRQIREILDEDQRINRRVLDQTFKMVRTYDKNSVKEPSPLEELVSWNIDKQISNLQEAIQNVIDGAINNTNMTIANEDISKISTAYNLLVSYIQNFAKSHKLNQRDKGALDMKFNEVEPLLNQLRQILSNPDAYNVEVSAQNLGVINHIEQQIRDSNYKGLNLVDYKKIPVSKNNPIPANNYRGYTPARSRLPFSPSDDDGNNGDDDESPRGRNQSVLQISPFVSALSERPGASHDNSPSFLTPSRQGADTQSYLTPYQLPRTFTPAVEEDPEEDIQSVSTLSQQTKTPTAKKPKKNQVSPLTPTNKLPSPQAEKVSFVAPKRGKNAVVFINGKSVIDDDGKPVEKDDWLYSISKQKREELILKTLSGKGNKRGKKHYEPIQESAILYDPDDNNLWAD